MQAKYSPILLLIGSAIGLHAHAAGNWTPTNTLAHPVQQLISGALDNGELAGGELVHVAISLALRNKPQLDSLTDGIQAGLSQPITDAQFMAQYAPTAAQVQQVVSHLQQNGFRNIVVSPNNMMVTADGSAATVNSAFQTKLRRYNVNGRLAYANVSNAQVPSSLAGIVLAVHGLQTAHQFHAAFHAQAVAKATTGIVAHKPTDFPAIYNASSLAAAKNSVAGIIAEGSLNQTVADLNSFAKSAGFAAPSVAIVNAGTPTSDTSGIVEWNLDSQTILAASGGALKQLQFYVAPSMNNSDIAAAINAAVSANSAKVINVSLGECELSAQYSGMTASVDQMLQAAIAHGQTFSVSSGDSGSYECGGGTAYQSYPAVSPYVVAVGGTTLTTSGTTVYSSEKTWSGGGGGPSYTEAAPSWQTSAGVLTTSKTKRGVPDIAFDADPNSGELVLVQGSTYQVGGTSLAAPLFTGFWSRIQSANANKLVSPNPAIYKYFKANASLYHDVSSGNNGAFKAASGWDYTTGWGSLNVANLNAFVAKTAGF
ncbi:protease pro-enzyme activation domain-containing protein [Chromobacterium sp. IIBBL 290-4]|uniref:S53 family peptidase n=1 Tax=Chromobacterium sp. IIBBL 290-4 TaxID=2953890 RepID=UPI0020B6B771|nr:S53 family peptidase [Chromobacterium sp. IIBBL 290-4]UTH73088.1 S53 family peptidase [Chromobacterium sp. IIBBL 290-4]